MNCNSYNLLIELGLSVNMIIVIVLIGEDLNSADMKNYMGLSQH